MYKDKQFRVRKLPDILADLELMSHNYSMTRRIFLADGDALIMKTEELEQILLKIKELYPDCERVGIYASPRSIKLKTPEELKHLASLGLGIGYLGLESGSDKILKQINKGETAAEIIETGKKLKNAGITVSVTAISGLGGKTDWKEHAIETGKAFTEMKPDYIGLLTLMVEEDTALREDYLSGKFELLSPKEVAMETYLMLQNIDSDGSTFRSNHASNYLSLGGELNRDKEAMLHQIESALKGDIQFRQEFMRGL